MASMPPGPAGGSPLDGPPPNPVNGPPPGSPGGFGGLGGQQPTGSPQQDQQALKAVVSMGADIDRAISGMAQATGGSDELMQAKQLIQAHLAKWLAAGPGALTSNPTAPGPQFPGASPSGPQQ